MLPDYYKVLGLQKNASQDDIKKAYKKLCKKYHPDVCKDDDARQRFDEITEAYECLSKPHNRIEYDEGRYSRKKSIPIKEQACGLIISKFEIIIQNNSVPEVKTRDLIDLINDEVIKEEQNLDKIKSQCLSLLKKLEEIQKRLDDDNGILTNVLDYKIKSVKSDLALSEERMEVCEFAHEMLKDFKYRTDERTVSGFLESMQDLSSSMTYGITYD